MKTIRDFEMNGDRYKYDFGPCTTGKGWAQVDTGQDASYFGTWANPFTLKIFNYCEGDTTVQEAETKTEFKEELNKIKTWNEENGHRFLGIDPGFNAELKNEFINMGLEKLLH